jgi:hypothetical protein
MAFLLRIPFLNFGSVGKRRFASVTSARLGHRVQEGWINSRAGSIKEISSRFGRDLEALWRENNQASRDRTI